MLHDRGTCYCDTVIAGDVHTFTAIAGGVHDFPLLRKSLNMTSVIVEDFHDVVAPAITYEDHVMIIKSDDKVYDY